MALPKRNNKKKNTKKKQTPKMSAKKNGYPDKSDYTALRGPTG